MIVMEKSYFDKPTQVVFADPDAICTLSVGIAYRDEIIGGILPDGLEYRNNYEICEILSEDETEYHFILNEEEEVQAISVNI